MKMTAKFEAEGESFNACFEQLNSAFNAEFSASGGGQDGKDGATFIPSVSEDGIISWTNDRELPNPVPVNIKGESGITPVKGIDYFTEQDVEEIAEQAAELVEIPEGGGGVTSWNDLTDKPDFAPIATSGSWNDLEDKPFGDKLDFSKEVYRSMGKFTFTDVSDGKYYAISTNIFVNLISGKKYQLTVSYMGMSTYAMVEGVALYNTLLKQFTVTGDGGSFYYDGNVMSITVKSDYPNLANPNFAPMMVVIIKEGNEVAIPLDEKYLPDSVVLESELEGKGYQTEEQVTALINNAIANLPRYNGEVEEI
jgi:hypothetical protein